MKYSQVDRAVEEIWALVLAGELKPGQPVTHRGLAARCGMSTVPMASAFRRLEDEGIIVSRPRRSGSNIALITMDELWDSLQLRLAIEQRALKLVIEQASTPEIDDIIAAANAAEWKTPHTIETIVKAEFNFHNTLLRCSHSPMLLRQNWVISDYQLKLLLCPEASATPSALDADPDDPPRSGHLKLAELIAARDPRASTMLESHVISCLRHPRFETRIKEAIAFLDQIFES